MAAGAAEPVAQVEALHAVLLQAMRHGGTVAERAEIVGPVVDASFDFQTIARISIGSSWKAIDSEARQRLVDRLRLLTVLTYADRFDSFEGQAFEQTGVVSGQSGTVVKSRILRSTGEPVSLHYYFREGRIFNVVADGVSDLALRRADYGSILRREGFAALMAHIERNVEALR